MEIKHKRITWIDGLKGMACICVFFHHFLYAFLPETYLGNNVRNVLPIKNLAQNPLMFWANGNFCVCIFMLISGYFVSTKVLTARKKENIADVIVKQYIKLSVPVFVISLIVYILLLCKAFYNLDAGMITNCPWLTDFYTNKISFRQVFSSAFVKVWIDGDTTFSNAFWMLNSLLLGNGLCVLLGTMAWKMNHKVLIIWGGVIWALMYSNSYCAVSVWGLFLAYLYLNYRNIFQIKIVGWFSLMLGIFFGGYPTGIWPNNIYKIFYIIPETYSKPQTLHIFAAVLVLYSFLILKPLQKIFENRILVFLGGISYSIYLVHIPLIFSASCMCFIKVYDLFGGYVFSVILTLVISLGVLLFLAWMFEKLIVKKWNIVVEKIFCKYLYK